MTTGKCLNTIKELFQLDSLDYNPDGTKFAAVGGESVLKIYDEQTRKVDTKLTGEACVVPGHNNRIYCVKYDKEDPNLLVTGGWDKRVIVWDLREKAPVRSLYGPSICGESVDIFEEVILTGSFETSNQLQMWDLGTCKPISTVNWDDGPRTTTDPVQIYASQFSKVDGSLILAGGSFSNEVKLFDRNNLDRHVCTIHDLSREVVTVDFSNKGNMFAVSGGDGYIRVYGMNIIA